MTADYQPDSIFLRLLGNDQIPLTGSWFAEANLRRLIQLTADPVVSNRDWATFFLSQSGIDTAEIRAALHLRLRDEDQTVQEEAMVGLAVRNDRTALPVLVEWMRRGGVSTMILEAASGFAEPSLCELLSQNRRGAEEASLEVLWNEAWIKCQCDGSAA